MAKTKKTSELACPTCGSTIWSQRSYGSYQQTRILDVTNPDQPAEIGESDIDLDFRGAWRFNCENNHGADAELNDLLDETLISI